MSPVAEGTFLGMGNPLLDISAVVKKDLLDKYELKANDAILYEKEDIYEDLKKDYEVEYIAGGATQNSMRVAQWILGESYILFCGMPPIPGNSDSGKKI